MKTDKENQKKYTESRDHFEELNEYEKGYKTKISETSCERLTHKDSQQSIPLEKFASKSFLNTIEDKMKETYSLETIPRRFLKKCKLCCFKKRLCFSSSSQCKALEKICFTCGKQGHFPKSRKCRSEKYHFTGIHQFDGADDENESTNRNINLQKEVYAVNCEINEVSTVANFLRTCFHIWCHAKDHELCEFHVKHKEMSCTYCFIRSCSSRLNEKRKKGPKGLKLYEFVYQLFKYQDKLEWNWRENRYDIVTFILNTLKLLRRDENSISSLFVLPNGKCHECHEKVPKRTKYIINLILK